MIKYYCDKDKIEENAIQPILDRIQEMDEICVFPDIHYCSEKSLPVGIAFSSIDKSLTEDATVISSFESNE